MSSTAKTTSLMVLLEFCGMHYDSGVRNVSHSDLPAKGN